jgi:hypothetical protein
VLRAGNVGSNTPADHIEAARLPLAQLPRHLRRRVLVRTGSGGGTRGFLEWLTAPSRRLRHSVGMTITADMHAAILKLPASAWTPAYDGDGQARDGARVDDVTGPLDLSGWPARRTPACGTCPRRASRRTSSGARSSPWPASCWPGPSSSP